MSQMDLDALMTLSLKLNECSRSVASGNYRANTTKQEVTLLFTFLYPPGGGISWIGGAVDGRKLMVQNKKKAC